MFVGVINIKTQQIRRWKVIRIRTECCRVSKISKSVGRNDNFLAKAWKLSILPTESDIFDIRQHSVRILYMSDSFISLIQKVNAFPHDNILDWYTLKAFADDKLM